MDADGYRPIACGFYDQLEAYATLRRKVRVTEISGGISEGRIRDFRTSSGKEEFLILEDGPEIRLDKILTVTALD